MPMNSYSEVRRVREVMSAASGHDVRRLIALINKRRPQCADRMIDPGTTGHDSNSPTPSLDHPSYSDVIPVTRQS